jgi:hypothetical protein
MMVRARADDSGAIAAVREARSMIITHRRSPRVLLSGHYGAQA